MNRRILTLVLSISVLTLTATSTVAAGAPAGFKLFTSAREHFRLYYPSSWHHQTFVVYDMFISPRVQGGTTSVILRSFPHVPVSLDAMAVTLARPTRDEKILGKIRTHVAGSPAWIVTAQDTSSQATVHNRWAKVIFLGRGQLWMVAYAGSLAGYSKYWNAFRTMLSSFTFSG